MNYHKQNGAVLIVSLIILAVLTVLGVTTMTGSNLQLKIAGNTQESYRDFHDAESGRAQAVSEWAATPGDFTGTSFVADYSVSLWASNPFRAIYLAQAASLNGRRAVYQWLALVDVPVNVDGTIGCYDGCDIDLTGNVHVDGRDHDPSNCTFGSPSSCYPDLSLTPQADIPAIYQATPGTVVQSGSTTLTGATPVIQTGGGVYTATHYGELATLLTSLASGHNGSSWGTRTNPIIHHIDEDGMTVNANIAGAGILIVTANDVTFNGNFDFEGLLILNRPGGVVVHMGGGMEICGAIVATSPGSQLDIGGAGTPRIVYCSTALDGAAGADSMGALGWAEQK